jgi:hypothetical protein
MRDAGRRYCYRGFREPPPRRPNGETTARAAARQTCRTTEVARPPLNHRTGFPVQLPIGVFDRLRAEPREVHATREESLDPDKAHTTDRRSWSAPRGEHRSPRNKTLRPCPPTTIPTLSEHRSPPKRDLSVLLFGDLTASSGSGPEGPSPCREPPEGGEAHRSSVHPNRSRLRCCHRSRLPTLR